MQECYLYHYSIGTKSYGFLKVRFTKQFAKQSKKLEVKNTYTKTNRSASISICICMHVIHICFGSLQSVIILHPSKMNKIVEMDKKIDNYSRAENTVTENFSHIESITSDYFQGKNEVIFCCTN